MDILAPAVAAIVVAILANGVGWWIARSQRQKLDADAADVLTGSALRMVERWERRVSQLEKEIGRLERKVRLLTEATEALCKGAARLEGQIVAMGHEPVWRLDTLGDLLARLTVEDDGEEGRTANA